MLINFKRLARITMTPVYKANDNRYQNDIYKRCGRSGLKLPKVSLGLWHNFGDVNSIENARDMLHTAFDAGITHFDLANNYGPPPGSAEENFGKIYLQDFQPYRDEIIISSKAGYDMWPGPYGNFGSRKYLVASLDQSLKRMRIPYVDIFYHHRPDPDTPLEESMAALDYIVRSGRALYVGISNYPAEQTAKAAELLREMGTPCLIHQPSYSMFNRRIEDKLLDVLEEQGMGAIVFSPLAQGLLTNKYLNGIPEDSRVKRSGIFLKESDITEEKINKVRALNELAVQRGQTMAQFAIAWILRQTVITSVLIGASRSGQILDAVGSLQAAPLSAEEIDRVDMILKK
jgi:L-glyceraldehyde 3-phosphate reductase